VKKRYLFLVGLFSLLVILFVLFEKVKPFVYLVSKEVKYFHFVQDRLKEQSSLNMGMYIDGFQKLEFLNSPFKMSWNYKCKKGKDTDLVITTSEYANDKIRDLVIEGFKKEGVGWDISPNGHSVLLSKKHTVCLTTEKYSSLMMSRSYKEEE